jgi:hypothetical protein
MSVSEFKSIGAVKTSNGWAVCQTNNDGSMLYVFPEVYEPRFSEVHAQHAAEMLQRHIELGGRSYAKALPEGVMLL